MCHSKTLQDLTSFCIFESNLCQGKAKKVVKSGQFYYMPSLPEPPIFYAKPCLYLSSFPKKNHLILYLCPICSQPHRILAPNNPMQKSATRRSIAFFVHPAEDLLIAEGLVKRDLANNNVTLLNMSTDDLQGMTVGHYVQRIFDTTYSKA